MSRPFAAPCPGNVLDEKCPSRAALALVSGKWPLLVVAVLRDGPVRNNQLLRQIGGISQKVLTQTLRSLERNGLVLRRDLGSRKLPYVEYRLSALGLSLSRALRPVDRWAERHHEAMAQARTRKAG